MERTIYINHLGEIMLKTIENKKIAEDIDIIIYIPTHKRKEALRGYNQAELLAVYISKNLEKTFIKAESNKD